MKTYFVEWEETCETCEGSGVVQHPEWSDYWAETNGNRHLPPKEQMEADDKWWANRGYLVSSKWPPEEVYCDKCDGEGTLHGRVSLSEALAALATAA